MLYFKRLGQCYMKLHVKRTINYIIIKYYDINFENKCKYNKLYFKHMNNQVFPLLFSDQGNTLDVFLNKAIESMY